MSRDVGLSIGNIFSLILDKLLIHGCGWRMTEFTPRRTRGMENDFREKRESVRTCRYPAIQDGTLPMLSDRRHLVEESVCTLDGYCF